MGTITPYQLEALSDDNCWLFFQQRAFRNGRLEDAAPKFIAIGKEIARVYLWQQRLSEAHYGGKDKLIIG